MKQKLIIFLIAMIPIASFSVGLLTIDHYGINWDEPHHYRRGQAFLHYMITGEKEYKGIPKYPPLKGTSDSGNFRNSDILFREVQDNPSLSDPNYRRSYYQDDAWNGQYFIDEADSYGHPPLNGVLASLSNYVFYQKLGILGDLESYRLFIVCLVFLMTFTAAFFMWKQFGIVESLVSSLALATYPLLLGEQHFNIKDPVETSFYTMSIIFLFLGITRKKALPFFLGILSAGAALATKFNIIFAVIPLTFWLFFFLKSKDPKQRFKFPKSFYLPTLLAPLVIFGILVVSFPAIWGNPASGIVNIFRYYKEVGSGFSQPSGYYLLNFINFYPALWIIITTPPITLLLFVITSLFYKKFSQNNYLPLLLAVWVLTSILRISLGGALSYGGVRLIMEFVPPMAMLAGISAGNIIKVVKSKNQKVLAFLLILLAFVPTIVKLIRIHPNENVYFNFLIGGLKGAMKKNINSWGNSNGNAYYQGVVWLNENAEEDARLTVPVNLIGNVPRFKLRKDISLSYEYWSGPAHKGEYVIELTYDYPPMQWFSLKYLNTVMKPLYEVDVDGVAIAKVWKNGPEFIKEEFKNQKSAIIPVKIDEGLNLLTIEMPDVEKLMQVSIFQPTQNCSPVKTGYVRTSVDGKNWIREPEDIAQDQLKQSRLKEASSVFDFYFVATPAKYIVFETANSDACILKSTQAKATTLKEK